MAKKVKGASSKSGQTPNESQDKVDFQKSIEELATKDTTVDGGGNPIVPSAVVPANPPAEAAVVPVATKKGSYDPAKAKAYRDKIKQAAIAGGHVFKEKGVGTGTTIKRVSKTGTTYYYQPWSQLSQDQKDERLAAARKRNAVDRDMAAKYKTEHPELFPVKESASNAAVSNN